MAHAATARRPRTASRRRAPSGIRWDRVGRAALLLVLAVILLLYASPLKNWLTQRGTAAEHAAEVRALEAENARLKERARALTSAGAIEREARRLGMIKQGERAYVIENLPGD
jgi:cell division protein FtsB